MPDRIPICLVTGFLGTGKTTLLKQIVQHHRERRLVYLVNEFSPRDIDGSIVSAEHPDVVSVPGGSIFCKCLVTQFIHQLQDLPERFPQIEGLVIEASGMANPRVMHTMLCETRLNERYRLARIVTVVDPGSFHKLRHTLPGIQDQIETADLALINKVDRFDAATCSATAEALREIKPNLTILTTTQCAAPFELFPTKDPTPVAGGTYAGCRDPNYTSREIAVPHPIDPVLLQEWLKDASADLYRLKGHVCWQGQTYHIDWTTTGCKASPSTPCQEPALVMIHRGTPSPSLADLLARLQPEAST